MAKKSSEKKSKPAITANSGNTTMVSATTTLLTKDTAPIPPYNSKLELITDAISITVGHG